MLDVFLEENIVKLLELKHPEEANQIENLIYCKYHRLINHLINKCFVLKKQDHEAIQEWTQHFYDKITASNITIMVSLGSQQSLFVISFGFFKPI
jgi:hypothetical protein